MFNLILTTMKNGGKLITNDPEITRQSPVKGDVKFVHGLRFVFSGDFWLLDQVIENTIDRHHNYSGQQDPKKPYRGAKESHVICGNKLLR